VRFEATESGSEGAALLKHATRAFVWPYTGEMEPSVLSNEKRKILLVDDEADMQMFISRLLASAGIKPIIATDIEEGLQKARHIIPSLIILDITMSGEQGVQMYCTLKQDDRLKSIPVIMLSNIDKKTFIHYQRIQCNQLGLGVKEPDAYLEKPPEAEEFIGLVQKLTSMADSNK
jgi:CheY-like chemotaxis protein